VAKWLARGLFALNACPEEHFIAWLGMLKVNLVSDMFLIFLIAQLELLLMLKIDMYC